MIIKFKSLRLKLFVLLLVPVGLLLGGAGLFGYFFMRDSLLKEWQEIAILRMERAAHQIDMRLHLSMQWMEALAKAENAATRNWILEQLRHQAGVTQVELTWLEAAGEPPPLGGISPITYRYEPGRDSFVLQGDLLDGIGKAVGRLEVTVAYDYLMKDILTTGWMQTQMACLVSRDFR